MDNRNQILDKFAEGMMDIFLSRSQLTSTVTLIFNNVTRDHYQDAKVTEEGRYDKLAWVKKNVSMNYVQELTGDLLIEDNLEMIPWIVSMTMSKLPRQPKMDDFVIIDGITYSISMVIPKNRNIQSVLSLLIYPERVDFNVK